MTKENNMEDKFNLGQEMTWEDMRNRCGLMFKLKKNADTDEIFNNDLITIMYIWLRPFVFGNIAVNYNHHCSSSFYIHTILYLWIHTDEGDHHSQN